MFNFKVNAVKVFIALSVSVIVTACTSIPTSALDTYLSNFKSAILTTQDIILIAKLDAEKSNDGSLEQQELLVQRIQALDARLTAIGLIEQYNNVLVKLASGTKPSDVKSSLEGLNNELGKFGVNELKSLGAEAIPYIGIISEAVALIDNAMKAEKFAEAVDKAQKPMLGIIYILQKDSRNLEIIHTMHLQKKREPELVRLTDLGFAFTDLANTLSDAKNKNLDKMIKGYNTALSALMANNNDRPNLIERKPNSKTHPANTDDVALLQTMVTQASAHVQAYNQIGDQIDAYKKIIEEYRKVLDATSGAFMQLNVAIQNKQALTGFTFAVNILELRKAYLKLQEAS